MSEYKPVIAQINFLMSSLEDVQNVDYLNVNPVPPQPVDRIVTPLVVAQYALYNRDLEEENFGLDDSFYLGYKGGFITAGDRVNFKKSDLLLRANVTVRKNATFYKTVSLENNSIRNVAQKFERFVPEVFGSTAFDHEALTVGDFRRNCHTKGMIMMWSGTYADLVRNLPYWRLCAPPDSNVAVENGVAVPNLEGFFIINGAYTDHNRYQPTDNATPTRLFGAARTFSHGVSGGFNAISLKIGEMPRHHHDVQFSITEGEISFQGSGGLRIMYAGGEISVKDTRTAKDACNVNIPTGSGCGSGNFTQGGGSCPGPPACTMSGHTTFHPTGYSIRSDFGTNPFNSGTMTWLDNPVGKSNFTQNNVGIGSSHENRPKFYVLGYIIYVGRART